MAGRAAVLSVRVVGDAKSGVSALNNTEKSASRLSRIGSAIGTGFKVGAGVVAAGAVATLGKAIQGGFQRLSGIENAQAKMRGLGHDTKAVDTIMANALTSVEGTAYGLDEAATVAASAVAAGIKPGKELEGTLGTISNAAAAAGTGMDEMGSIFTKVASTGKAQNDSLNQVADRGIPIYDSLAKQLGVTTEEVFKMASAGDIGFDQFQKAMGDATGSVADELGKTATGSMANFNAALSRLGAGLLAGVFPQIAPLIQAATGVIDRIAEAAGPATDALGNKLGGAVAGLAGWLEGLQFDSLESFLASAGPGFVQIGDAVNQAMPGFQAFAAKLPEIAASSGTLVSGGITILGNVLGFLAENMDTLVGLLPAIVAGFAAWNLASSALAQSQLAVRATEAAMAPLFLANQALRFLNVRAERQLAIARGQATVAQLSQTTAERAGMLTRAGSTAGIIAQRTAMIASTVATKAATIAQRALNLAMRMNPIGLIISALTLLVGGIIWAWNNVDWFRNGIITAWNWIKETSITVWTAITDALTAAWDWIVGIFTNNNPTGVLANIWNNIKGAASSAWNWIKNAVGVLWNGLVRLFQTVHPVGIIIKHWDKIKAATVSVWNGIKSFFGGIWNGLINTVSRQATRISTTLRTAWNNVKAMTSNAWNNFKNSITNGIDSAVSVVRSIPRRFRSAMGNLGNMLRNAGRSIVTGFANGIKSAIHKATGAARNLVRRVRDFFPFSPAKTGPFSGRGYTSHSGSTLVGDFATAMLSQSRQVRSAASSIASAGRITGEYDVPTVRPAAAQPYTVPTGTAAASRRQTPSVVIERGAIQFNGLVSNPDDVGREIVTVLDRYFARRGTPWRAA